MSKLGGFSMSGYEQFQKQLNKIGQNDIDAFVESCAKELAARLLREVIYRTPVGEYSGGEYDCKARKDPLGKHKSSKSPGKKGGTLRRGWTAGKNANAAAYANSLTVNRFGDTCVIEIINPVEYASYVEYGHRTPNHAGWVIGHFMMKKSEIEVEKIAPQVLESKIKKFLGECMK
ncbi:MAG: HK97 gp10 family phage protein [Oscillospiraceae bacterium]|nr:HK97 gp10 family phage protein [Oscillospiraceae bacterium]